MQRAYPTSLQQESRRPGEDPLQLCLQVNASTSRERDRGVEAEVPPAQHWDAQDGAARLGEDDPGVRSAVSVVEDDEREGDERGHEDVHGQGEVHPITVHREARRELARRGEAFPV